MGFFLFTVLKIFWPYWTWQSMFFIKSGKFSAIISEKIAFTLLSIVSSGTNLTSMSLLFCAKKNIQWACSYYFPFWAAFWESFFHIYFRAHQFLFSLLNMSWDSASIDTCFIFKIDFQLFCKLHDQYLKIAYVKDFICLYIYICIGIFVCHVVFSQMSRNPRPVWKLLVLASLRFAGKTLKEGIKWASWLVKPNLKWQKKNESMIEKKRNPEVGNSIWDWDSSFHSWMPIGNIWRALKKYGYLGPFPEVRATH